MSVGRDAFRALAASLVLVIGFSASATAAVNWPQFRGPNASGVSDAKSIPVEFGPKKNVVWKTELPAGHSSPVLSGDRVFLTAFDDNTLFVICLDRQSGKVQWRREVPRPRKQELHKSNSPASPSVVTDGKNVFAFFTDFGMVSYGFDGNERWRVPMGPFNNPFGMGASPVLAGGSVLQICDSESGSFMVAIDQKDGRQKWRVERPEMSRGFATPVLYQPTDGPQQAIVAGTNQLTAYAVETGEVAWFVRGLTWQLKPTPVMSKDVIYVLGWAGGADTGQQEDVAPFADVLGLWDADKNARLTQQEIGDEKVKKQFAEIDLDKDGAVGERDWRLYKQKRSSQNAVLAFRLGGKGDMTEKSLLWRYTKSLPNVPSPLLYQGVLYLMKEGGIFTSLNPTDGTVLKQGRLPGALDQYFASPVAAEGKIYAVSEDGHVSVVKAGGEWEVLHLNDMEDQCYATPAFEDGRIYVRTRGALYCFGKSSAGQAWPSTRCG